MNSAICKIISGKVEALIFLFHLSLSHFAVASPANHDLFEFFCANIKT